MMKMSLRYALLVFAAGLSLNAGLSTDAQAQDLTLEQALVMALEQSPEIDIASERTEQGVFSVDEANASYYPQVDLFAEAGREFNNPASSRGATIASGTGDTTTSADATLSINQFLFDGFETQEEVARRKQLIESSKIQEVRVEAQIILDTIEAYTSILRSQRELADSSHFLRVMDGIEDKIVLMVEAGAESPAKLKFVQARLASARQRNISIRSRLADARTDLEQLIGIRPEFQAQHPSGSFIVLEDLETYYLYAQKHNQEILVNQSDKKALEHQLSGLSGAYYPKVNALVELNQNHDVGGDIGRDRNASAQLQVNYRLFGGFAAKASRNRVMSQIRELDHRIDQVTRDTNQRLKLLYNQLQSLKNEWLILEQEIEANDEVRVLNQEQFELGEADILELVESEERYFNSKIRKHRIEFDFTQTIHQLKQEAGLLNKDAVLNPEDI